MYVGKKSHSVAGSEVICWTMLVSGLQALRYPIVIVIFWEKSEGVLVELCTYTGVHIMIYRDSSR